MNVPRGRLSGCCYPVLHTAPVLSCRKRLEKEESSNEREREERGAFRESKEKQNDCKICSAMILGRKFFKALCN